MNKLLKLMRYRPFLGQGGSGGGGSSEPVDFLTLKTTMTEYRNDKITELPNEAFSGCKNLKKVVLPAVTRLQDYGDVFSGCDSLEVVDFTALTYLCGPSIIEDNGDVRYSNPLPYGTKALINRGGLFQIGGIDNSDPDYYYESDFAYAGCCVYIPREYIVEENFVQTSSGYPHGYDWEYLYTSGYIRPLEDYTVDGTVTGELDMEKI